MRNRLKKLSQWILIVVFAPAAWFAWLLFEQMPATSGSYILSSAAFVVIWLMFFVIVATVVTITCNNWIRADNDQP